MSDLLVNTEHLTHLKYIHQNDSTVTVPVESGRIQTWLRSECLLCQCGLLGIFVCNHSMQSWTTVLELNKPMGAYGCLFFVADYLCHLPASR